MADASTKNSSSIVLFVKVTNLAAADLTVEGANDWTVGLLKERISTLLPSRPAVNQQKLVYYGKLLEDRQTLVDALKQNTFGGGHTLHLVLSDDGMNNPNIAASSQSNDSTAQASTSGSAALTGDAYAGSMLYSQPNAYFGYPPMFTTITSGWPAEAGSYMTAQQYLWMQLYTQQVQHWHAMLQQQAQLAGSRSERAVATDGMVPGAGAYIHGPAPQQPQQAAAAAAPDLDIVRMNAQGGDDDADGGENQDVLDWLYMGMRVLLLFCILYFYSSLGRLMLVFTVGMALWMFRGGLPRRDGAARVPVAAQREARAPEAPERQPQPARNQPEPDNGSPGAPQNQTVNPTAAAGRSILAVAASVVGNFFATLIPHHPPAGNLN